MSVPLTVNVSFLTFAVMALAVGTLEKTKDHSMVFYLSYFYLHNTSCAYAMTRVAIPITKNSIKYSNNTKIRCDDLVCWVCWVRGVPESVEVGDREFHRLGFLKPLILWNFLN